MELIPIWLSVMKAFVGLQEIAGPTSNPVILQWVKDLNAPSWYDNDDKPWCALGLNRVLLACQLPLAPRPGDDLWDKGYGLFRASSFETWGVPLTIPALGCVMTFSRPEGNHVGLYLGERKDAYYILGMNQSNTVGAAWIKKDRLTSTRWPSSVPVTQVGRIWLTSDGAVSTNEG